MGPACLVSILGNEGISDQVVRLVVQSGRGCAFQEAKLLRDLVYVRVYRDSLGAIHREKGNTIRDFAPNPLQLSQFRSHRSQRLPSKAPDPGLSTLRLNLFQAFHDVGCAVAEAKSSQLLIRSSALECAQ